MNHLATIAHGFQRSFHASITKLQYYGLMKFAVELLKPAKIIKKQKSARIAPARGFCFKYSQKGRNCL